MKNGERLFEKFGEVNEKYIHEAENFAATNAGSIFLNENTEGFQNEITEDSGTEENIRIVRKTGGNRIVKTAAIAAAFLLVCGGIFKYHLVNSNNGNNIPVPASTAEVSDTEVTEETEITESSEETEGSLKFNSDGTMYYVPDLTNLPYWEAEETYGELFEYTKCVYDDTIAEGYIIKTDPPAGTELPVGSKLCVIASMGCVPESLKTTTDEKSNTSTEENEFIVPDLVGRDLEEVIEQYNGLIRFYIKEQMFSEDYPRGTILDQDFEPDTAIEPGKLVQLVVSKGPMALCTKLPDLIGKDAEETKKALEDLGITVNTVIKDTDKVPEGKVADFSIDPGTKIELPAEVTMFVSSGHGEETERIINLQIPESADGNFTVKAYVDNELWKEYSYDINGGETISFPISASGESKAVTLILKNFDLEAELGRYSISFDPDDSEYMEIISEDVEGAFREVCGSY